MRAETMLISTQTACAEQCACAGQRTHLGSRPKNGQAVLGGAPAIMLTICFKMYREDGTRPKDHAEDGGSAKSRCGFHLQWAQRYSHQVF